MKMRCMLKKLMIVGCMAAVIFVQKPVYAEGLDELGTVVDGSLLTDLLVVEDDSRDLLRGNYLSYGTASLVNHEDGTVSAGGSTIAHVVCDKVYLTLTLQQKVGDDWYDYRTWKRTTTNASSLSKEYTVEVPSGFFYRVQGAHLVEKDGDNTESQVTLTDGVWVAY
ncbi:MAG: DUF6147 family protein [Lachnospiraceae bacterium]|jgi:hypothetical protein